MSENVYLKIAQSIEVSKEQIKLKDFSTLYCKNISLQKNLKEMSFFQFTPKEKKRLVVSVIYIIEEIKKEYPDIEIVNLGESDFILFYNPTSGFEKLKEWGCTIFICLIAFLGGGYSIMAYNTDVGAKELFTNLSMIFLGNAKTGVQILSISYAFGIFFGMMLFFNHIGGKKINSDPTPLEIQMRLYEQEISQAIIKETNRTGENIEGKKD